MFHPALALSLLVTHFACAQSPAPTMDSGQVEAQIQLLRSDFQAEARKLVNFHLELSESESKVFWPIYAEYELAQSKLADRRFALLRKYADRFESMDARTVLALEKESHDIQKQNLKTNHTFFKRIAKAVSPLQAARWLQLETTLSNVRELRAAASVPLIGSAPR